MKWSFSADRCFRRCQRQYLFRNIVAHHNARKVPERREAFLLTQLKTLEQWRGLLVHDGITAFAVPKWEAGELIDWGEVADRTVAMAGRQLAFSAARRYREDGVTKSKHPLEYCALADHEGGGAPSPAAVEAVFAEVRQAFANLAGMAELLTHIQGRGKYWAECPVVVKYEDVNVEAHPDLLFFRSFGKPAIIEWKTYEQAGGSDAHLQAALYAWALCRSGSWKVRAAEDVELIEVQLLTGQFLRHLADEGVFAELEDRIYRSVQEIRALCGDHRYEGQDRADFAYASNPNSCRTCPLRPLCLRG